MTSEERAAFINNTAPKLVSLALGIEPDKVFAVEGEKLEAAIISLMVSAAMLFIHTVGGAPDDLHDMLDQCIEQAKDHGEDCIPSIQVPKGSKGDLH